MSPGRMLLQTNCCDKASPDPAMKSTTSGSTLIRGDTGRETYLKSRTTRRTGAYVQGSERFLFMNPHATGIAREGVRGEVSLRAVRRVTGLEDTVTRSREPVRLSTEYGRR